MVIVLLSRKIQIWRFLGRVIKWVTNCVKSFRFASVCAHTFYFCLCMHSHFYPLCWDQAVITRTCSWILCTYWATQLIREHHVFLQQAIRMRYYAHPKRGTFSIVCASVVLLYWGLQKLMKVPLNKRRYIVAFSWDLQEKAPVLFTVAQHARHCFRKFVNYLLGFSGTLWFFTDRYRGGQSEYCCCFWWHLMRDVCWWFRWCLFWLLLRHLRCFNSYHLKVRKRRFHNFPFE